MAIESIGSGDDDPARTHAERRSEPSELDALYRTHAADVSRFIRRLAGPDETADQLHDVFLVVQRRWSEFRGEAAVRTWLYAIAVRVVVARRRKRRLRRLLWWEQGADQAPALQPDHVATPEQLAERDEASRQVYAVLERLPERARTFIVLFELEGLPAREIARILELSENGVWVGLHRARARFRDAFVALYGSEDVSRD